MGEWSNRLKISLTPLHGTRFCSEIFQTLACLSSQNRRPNLQPNHVHLSLTNLCTSYFSGVRFTEKQFETKMVFAGAVRAVVLVIFNVKNLSKDFLYIIVFS